MSTVSIREAADEAASDSRADFYEEAVEGGKLNGEAMEFARTVAKDEAAHDKGASMEAILKAVKGTKFIVS